MNLLRPTAIQNKLVLVIMLTCLCSLGLAALLLLTYEARTARNLLRREMGAMADVIGANSTAAIEFEDVKAARQILSALTRDARVVRGRLLRPDKRVFAEYVHPQRQNEAPIVVRQPITLESRLVGEIELSASPREIRSRLMDFMVITAVALLISALAAYLLALRLGRIISDPIVALSETTKKVADTRDYSLRAERTNNDETGMLVDRFNEMMDQLQSQNKELEDQQAKLSELNEALEERVRERTKQLEESHVRLRQSERLASLGILSAGVAHEIRNPINAILLAANFVLRYSRNIEDTVKEALTTTVTEAKRCAKIVENILVFARSENKAKAPHDVNEALLHAADLARTYQSDSSVVIHPALREPLSPVLLNQTEIEQVFLNLITNAIEAAETEVNIQLETDEDDEAVIIRVRDDGSGIPKEDLQHIFDPFFSTKRRKGNTGLGLSLSHGIIEQHGGTISVESQPGEGTTFGIRLPKA